MNNLCFNRFTLRTDDAKTRRKILRWLAINYLPAGLGAVQAA